jgi:hypothetical protein
MSSAAPTTSTFPRINPIDTNSYYQHVIESTLKQYKYDAYYPELAKIDAETLRWKELKGAADTNFDKQSLTARFQSAVKNYVQWSENLDDVKKIHEIFQKNMNYCYPDERPPLTITKEIVLFLQRLGFDPEPIKEKYDEILTAHFEGMKDKNRKMAFLYAEMSKKMKDLKSALEFGAKLTTPDSGFNLFGPSPLEAAIAAAKGKIASSAQGSAKG